MAEPKPAGAFEDYALYGYSLFETMWARGLKLWRADAHFERLVQGAAALSLEPPSRKRFFDRLVAHLASGQDRIARVTLAKTGGRWSNGSADGTELFVTTRPYQPVKPQPLHLHLSSRRFGVNDAWRCYKTGSRLGYQWVFDQARAANCHDGLIVDDADCILETSTHNLFFLIDEAWVTPATRQGLLPGIARGWVMEGARVREEAIPLSALSRCKAAVATNAVIGAVPIEKVADRALCLDLAKAWIETLGTREFAPIDTKK